MRFYILIVFIGFTKPIASQNWEAISPLHNLYLNTVWKDTVKNDLYISGSYFKVLGKDTFNGIARYDGYNWYKLKNGLVGSSGLSTAAVAVTALNYSGKILFGGDIYGGDTCKAQGIIYYDGQNFSKFTPELFTPKQYNVRVFGLYNIDDTLYICGAFDTIQSKPAKGFAKLVGNNWVPIDLVTQTQNNTLQILLYKQQKYVIGQFYNNNFNDGFAYILKYENGIWVSVGGGLKGGGVNNIWNAVVFKNELYVCGLFYKSSGNYGHNIQKWDGINWSDVNTTDLSIGFIRGMKVFNNHLYVYGSISSVSDGSIISKTGIARWDGLNWCSSKDEFTDVTITSMELYNNKLIVGGGFSAVNSNTNIAYLAQLKCDDFCSDTCKYYLPPAQTNGFTIYPNPSNGNFTINSNGVVPTSTELKVYNSIRQLVMATEFVNALNVSNQAAGIYFLQITVHSKLYCYKLVIE